MSKETDKLIKEAKSIAKDSGLKLFGWEMANPYGAAKTRLEKAIDELWEAEERDYKALARAHEDAYRIARAAGDFGQAWLHISAAIQWRYFINDNRTVGRLRKAEMELRHWTANRKFRRR